MNFLPHALAHALEQGAAPTQNYVLKEVPPHVHVALHHAVVAVLVDPLQLVLGVLRTEQDFTALEPLVAN